MWPHRLVNIIPITMNLRRIYYYEEDEAQSGTQYHDKLKVEIASDTLPDAFFNWGGSEVREAVESKKFMDLTKMLKADPQYKNDFSEAALKDVNVTYTDIPGQWGIPFELFGTGFFYNKELFEKANVEPPKTWDELLVVIDKLKATGTIPLVIGAKDGWRVQHLYTALFYKLNGVGKKMDLANRTAKYSDDFAVEPFEKIVELRDIGAFGPHPASVDFTMEQTLFKTGKAAMNFSLNAFIGTFTGEDSAIADKVGFFPTPYFKSKEQYKQSEFGGGAACISASSKLTGTKEEAAYKLIKTFTGKDGQKLFLEANAIIPVVKGIKADPEMVLPLQNDFTKVLTSAKEFGGDITDVDPIASMLNKLRSVCSALVNEQLTPEQAAKEMDREIEKNK